MYFLRESPAGNGRVNTYDYYQELYIITVKSLYLWMPILVVCEDVLSRVIGLLLYNSRQLGTFLKYS